MKATVTVKIYNPKATANRICKNPKVGAFLAQTWAREMDPFVPKRTGDLKDSWKSLRQPFEVNYKTPYARKMFYGVTEKGKRIIYRKTLHLQATARWDKAAECAKAAKVARELEAFIKRM